MHRLGIASRISINLLVCRIGGMSVGESYRRFHYTLNLFEIMFRSPETSTSQKDVLTFLYLQDTVNLMLYEWASLALLQDAQFRPIRSLSCRLLSS